MASGRCGAFDVENIFLVHFKPFPGLLKSYMKTLKGWKREKTETLSWPGSNTFTCKHMHNTRDKAGLLASAQSEAEVFSCPPNKVINLLNYGTAYQFPLAGKCSVKPCRTTTHLKPVFPLSHNKQTGNTPGPD